MVRLEVRAWDAQPDPYGDCHLYSGRYFLYSDGSRAWQAQVLTHDGGSEMKVYFDFFTGGGTNFIAGDELKYTIDTAEQIVNWNEWHAPEQKFKDAYDSGAEPIVTILG